MWEERIDATVYTVTNAKAAKEIRKLAGKNATDKSILEKYNVDSIEVVTIKSALFLPGQDSNVDKLNKAVGIGEDILNATGSITFVKINKIVAPAPKTLDEARGYVISAYQDQLEKQWIDELHQKYPVVINQQVFNSMVR
jgi:peptidyl-prolyl cis-trans isomerase SurA